MEIKINKRYTKHEDNFIKENYLNMTDKEMSLILKRSESSVSSRRRRHLKLHREKTSSGRYCKLTYELVKDFIEVESNSGCSLISKKYINNVNPLLITCSRCGGEYSVTFNQFKDKKKYICNKCSFTTQYDKRKHSFDFVKGFIEDLGYRLISDKYENNQTKLILLDRDGFKYTTIFNTIQQGNGLDRFNKSNIYTIDNIKFWCKINNKPFELISDKYEGSQKKLKWKCLKDGCGEIFEVSWSNVFASGTGCGVCHGHQVGLSNCLAIKRPELVKEWHPTKNNDLTPYNISANSSKKVWWQCSKNPKHEWYVRPADRHNGCPYCSGKLASDDNNLLVINPTLCEEWDYERNLKTPKEYTPNSSKKVWWKCSKNPKHSWKALISSRNSRKRGCPYCAGQLPSEDYNLLVVNPELCKEWDYSKNEKPPEEYTPNSKFKVWWKCNECNYEWIAVIHSRNGSTKSGCPECNKSRGEKRISKWLNYENIVFQPQKEFEGLIGLGGGNLSYDFHLPQFNLLIEYQGEFHDGKANKYVKENLKVQKEHDKRKREYAEKNNIRLLEIWYWDFDNIDNILNDYLNRLKYKEELII